MTKRKMTDIKNFKVVIYRTALYSPILLRSPHMNTHPPPTLIIKMDLSFRQDGIYEKKTNSMTLQPKVIEFACQSV